MAAEGDPSAAPATGIAPSPSTATPPEIQKEKAAFVTCLLGFHFMSFLVFSALLGEPSRAAHCMKVKCSTVHLGFFSRRV